MPPKRSDEVELGGVKGGGSGGPLLYQDTNYSAEKPSAKQGQRHVGLKKTLPCCASPAPTYILREEKRRALESGEQL